MHLTVSGKIINLKIQLLSFVTNKMFGEYLYHCSQLLKNVVINMNNCVMKLEVS